MCLLFESIRVTDGQLLNLPYHQQRVAKWSNANLATYINNNANYPSTGTHKLRITYRKDGIYGHSIEPYTPRIVESLRLTIEDNIDYEKKFNDRTVFDNLMARRGDCDDILIIKNGIVTDTSFANIVFFDGQNWVTPETPLLEGTCRARLIDQNIITPRVIMPTDLTLFSKFMIINSMLDFDTQRAVEYRFNRRCGSRLIGISTII